MYNTTDELKTKIRQWIRESMTEQERMERCLRLIYDDKFFMRDLQREMSDDEKDDYFAEFPELEKYRI